MHTVDTDILIVGTGPAGASLACFLASHGIKGIVIGAGSGSIKEPRAHITNASALECLRDIGLEDECMAAASGNENMVHSRWCHDMAGEEYFRIYSWGNDPDRKGEYLAASPCSHVDLPQTLLEPILIKYLQRYGFTCRFNSRLRDFERLPTGRYSATIEDTALKLSYKITSKYLFGADGGRSIVADRLGLPFVVKSTGSKAMNILTNVDLSPYVQHRVGNLHYMLQPERENTPWSFLVIARMVKPWTEWMFIGIPSPGEIPQSNPSHEECVQIVRDFVGDPSIPIEVLDVSVWNINEVYAEQYSKENAFILGDAAHRHPPFNGLGSNTSIMDAYNLAWKVAYVEKGLADASILDTYESERQPVGAGVVTRANAAPRAYAPIFEGLGVLEFDPAKGEFKSLSPTERVFRHNRLKEASEQGAKQRKQLREGAEDTTHEHMGLGVETNQRYVSAAVYLDDEQARPPLPDDPILHHEITTYPGSRLPHAWLNTAKPGRRLSTIDLAGHGEFCLITGIGGEQWRSAARQVQEALGVKIRSYSIGWRQDYEDVYLDWQRRREVDEDGCVLLRPDRFVAWRAMTMVHEPEKKLASVMQHLLGWQKY